LEDRETANKLPLIHCSLLKKIGTEMLTFYGNQNYMDRKIILLNDYRMISPFLSAASTTVMFVEANAGLSLDF